MAERVGGFEKAGWSGTEEEQHGRGTGWSGSSMVGETRSMRS